MIWVISPWLDNARPFHQVLFTTSLFGSFNALGCARQFFAAVEMAFVVINTRPH